MNEDIERVIRRLEEERESYVAQRDKAVAEIAKRDAAIESLRQLAPPSLPSALIAPHPHVSIAERKASWIPQPIDSYQPSRIPSGKVKAVTPPRQPDHGPRPEGAGSDWVSLIASQASPFALALAFLREAPSPFTSAQLNAALAELRGIRGGAGYTTLEPLQHAQVIEPAETANQWNILDRSRGGIIANGFLWSAPNLLNVYDWAVLRREALVMLMQDYPEGLRSVVITKTLMSCSWLRAPVDPHLIKADLRRLESKGFAEQNPTDKTWRLTTENQGPTESLWTLKATTGFNPRLQ